MKRMMVLLLASCVAFPMAAQEDPAIANAKAVIASKLKDPDSAQFRAVVHKAKEDGSAGTVCGWVNARNSFGGYVGFRPFYVMGSIAEVRDAASAGSLNNHGMFASLWPRCNSLPEEQFGSEMVKLPRINIERECDKKRKRTSDRPDLYQNCEANEASARAWLESRPTSGLAAHRCEQEIRRYGSYQTGKFCVEREEMEVVFRRGPGPEIAAP